METIFNYSYDLIQLLLLLSLLFYKNKIKYWHFAFEKEKAIKKLPKLGLKNKKVREDQWIPWQLPGFSSPFLMSQWRVCHNKRRQRDGLMGKVLRDERQAVVIKQGHKLNLNRNNKNFISLSLLTSIFLNSI